MAHFHMTFSHCLCIFSFIFVSHLVSIFCHIVLLCIIFTSVTVFFSAVFFPYLLSWLLSFFISSFHACHCILSSFHIYYHLLNLLFISATVSPITFSCICYFLFGTAFDIFFLHSENVHVLRHAWWMKLGVFRICSRSTNCSDSDEKFVHVISNKVSYLCLVDWSFFCELFINNEPANHQ